jgi:hypothetical protein
MPRHIHHNCSANFPPLLLPSNIKHNIFFFHSVSMNDSPRKLPPPSNALESLYAQQFGWITGYFPGSS